MTCWHCKSELDINYQSNDFKFKFYHCDLCDKWYEMRKEDSKLNGAVPIKFEELTSKPNFPMAV